MSSNVPQKAKITTPQSQNNSADVKVEEIPLPPQALWAELENGGSSTGDQAEPRVGAAAPAVPSKREIAQLQFTKETFIDIPLAFPFTHADIGLVDSIRVHRLTVGEVGDILDGRAADAPDMFDIYEAMTFVPAAVLRGLISEDGEAVTGACFDFLPRMLRPVPRASSASSST